MLHITQQTQQNQRTLILGGSLIACLLLGMLTLLPSRAFADSTTLALACKPDAATAVADADGAVSCDATSSSEHAYIAAVGTDTSTYPSNVAVTVVTADCGSDKLADKDIKDADATQLECHSGKDPTVATVSVTPVSGGSPSPTGGGAGSSVNCNATGNGFTPCPTSNLCAQGSSSGCDCAQDSTTSDCEDPAVSCDSSHCDLIAEYLNPFIKVLSGLVGLVVVISLIFGGIQYSASEGDPQKAAQAKSRITKTVFAFIVFIFLFALLQFLVPGGIFTQ